MGNRKAHIRALLAKRTLYQQVELSKQQLELSKGTRQRENNESIATIKSTGCKKGGRPRKGRGQQELPLGETLHRQDRISRSHKSMAEFSSAGFNSDAEIPVSKLDERDTRTQPSNYLSANDNTMLSTHTICAWMSDTSKITRPLLKGVGEEDEEGQCHERMQVYAKLLFPPFFTKLHCRACGSLAAPARRADEHARATYLRAWRRRCRLLCCLVPAPWCTCSAGSYGAAGHVSSRRCTHGPRRRSSARRASDD
jgi:hypothetical protein